MTTEGNAGWRRNIFSGRLAGFRRNEHFPGQRQIEPGVFGSGRAPLAVRVSSIRDDEFGDVVQKGELRGVDDQLKSSPV